MRNTPVQSLLLYFLQHPQECAVISGPSKKERGVIKQEFRVPYIGRVYHIKAILNTNPLNNLNNIQLEVAGDSRQALGNAFDLPMEGTSSLGHVGRVRNRRFHTTHCCRKTDRPL